jgi:HlyD family secretion protein
MRRTLAFVPLAAALALASCHKPGPKTTDAEQARTVRVIAIEPRSITGSLTASGDLVSREEAAVTPEVNGYRVARVLADVGDTVKKGQTLVELDPTLIQAQLAQQQALAAQADAQALQAEAQAARVKGLDDAGVLAEEQIEQRRFQAKAARATANAQAAALKDIRARASKFAVAAPVSGLVLERTVRPGDISAVTTTPWFRIARDDEIELQAQLSEDDLARLKPGEHAEVSLPSGEVFPGVIRLVSPQIDPQTKLGAVRVHLPVNPAIRAGGFGRAIFTGASGAALAVPETAVRYDADGASVMVVGADHRVKRALVQTGQRGSGLVQLIKGPPAGTRVVLSAAAFLLDGDLIKPLDAGAPGPVTTPAATKVSTPAHVVARK